MAGNSGGRKASGGARKSGGAAGDENQSGAPEAQQDQGDGGETSGDKAGEPQTFELGEDHAAIIDEALGKDEGPGGRAHLNAALALLGPALGFDPDSAMLSDPAERPLIITALPIAATPAAKLEDGRQEFAIPEDMRPKLEEARQLDSDQQAGSVNEDAFWSAVCARTWANPATVEATEEMIERGVFTAWPIETPERDFNPATNEADHTDALDRMEAIIESAEMDPGTLGGDLRNTMLDIFRTRHKGWDKMSPSEQRDVSAAIDVAVKQLVTRAVAILAAAGRSSITATLEKYADKGGEITATIKIVAAQDETVLSLHRASGKAVLIIAADAGDYLGQRRPAPIDEEEPQLSFSAGSDAAARAGGDDDEDADGDEDLATAADLVVDEDALYRQAVELVRPLQTISGTASWLQRKLEVGYTIATRIVTRMEAEGIIGPADVTTKRPVLIYDPDAAPPGGSGEPGDGTDTGASAETAEA